MSLHELILIDGGRMARLKALPQYSWPWNSVATLPTANLIRLQLVEHGAGAQTGAKVCKKAVGQRHIGH